MPLIMECQKCRKRLKINQSNNEGISVRCPYCKNVFKLAPQVPSSPAASDPVDPTPDQTRDFDPSETKAYHSTATDQFSTNKDAAKLPLETKSHEGTLPALDSVASRSLPTKIGRFEIRRLLGEGAFGKVYEAYDPQLDRAVALKVAKGDLVASEERAKRFVREAKAAANLRHPNIVPIYEFGQDGPSFYIVLAFIKGKPLDKFLKKNKPVPIDRCVPWIRGLAEALAYAHGQGIVHRDIKPANVLLDDRGEPMLADFGLAAREDEAEKLTHQGTVLGTPLYMSPEQARGQEGSAQPASDQYSLGVMLYHLLTGRPPFEGSMELVLLHHQQKEPPPPRTKNRAIPGDLETICLKCLEKEPQRRYPDCQALADDLRRWQEGQPIQARRIGPVERFGRWCQRNPLEACLVALVVFTLIAGTTFSSYFGFREWQARGAADRAALEAALNESIAKQQSKRAEESELLEKQQAALARESESIAKQQSKRAEESELLEKQQATLARQNAARALEEAEKARRESQRAERVSRFLVGLFDSVDPVGLTGYAFGPDPKHGGKLLAKDVLERGVKRIRVDLKDEPETRATVLMTIGSVLRTMGQYEDAKPLLEESLKTRQELPTVPPAEVAESWFHLGWLHHQAGNDLEGMHCYREALKRIQDKPGHEVLISQCEFNIAWLLAQQNVNETSEKLFRKVLAERQQRLGAGHYEVAVAQAGLASVLFQMQKKGEAIAYVVPALQTFRKAHGDESIATAAGLAQEAMISASLLNVQGAKIKMDKVVELTRTRLGDNHPFVAWALGITGDMMATAGKKKDAIEYNEKALQVCREGMGLDHVMVLRVVRTQAGLLAKSGDSDAGCKLYEEMLQQVRTRKGESHFLLALVLDDYGNYLVSLRRFPLAEATFRQALAVDRKIPEAQRIKQIHTRLSLVNLIKRRNAAEAEQFLHEELKVLAESNPKADENDPSNASVVCDLVTVLIKQKKFAEAVPWLQKLSLASPKIPKDVLARVDQLKSRMPIYLLEETRLQAGLVGAAASPSSDFLCGPLGLQLMQLYLSEPIFDFKVVKTPTLLWEDKGALTAKSTPDRLQKAAYCKIYPVTLEAGVCYQIDMTSSEFDCYLRLEDTQGKVLAKDDDGGGDLNARILYTPLKTSLVHIVATTFGNQKTGAYKLVHQRCETRQELVVQTTVLRKTERLTEADPLDPRDSRFRVKVYSVPLVAGTAYQIDLMSDEFDAFLRLEDEKGRVLATDDDGGGDPNARLHYRPLRTGTYRVFVTTFNANETGEFVLLVRK